MTQERRHTGRRGADKKIENWLQTHWRPMMAWQYMFTCLCDFVVFPVLWSALQTKDHGQLASQWQPITLLAGGFYHMSMGAIIGVAAWGRTKEKTNDLPNLPMAQQTSYGSQAYSGTQSIHSYPQNSSYQVPAPTPAVVTTTPTPPKKVSANLVPQDDAPEL